MENNRQMELLDKSALLGSIDRMRQEYMEGSDIDKAFKTLEVAIALMPPVTIRFPQVSDFDDVERILDNETD